MLLNLTKEKKLTSIGLHACLNLGILKVDRSWNDLKIFNFSLNSCCLYKEGSIVKKDAIES